MFVDEGKVLGQKTGYPKSYCPEILVPIPRFLNRELYGIDEPDTLFCGFDTWHAFECSALTNKGIPVVFTLKIVYPSTSEFIVESKSLKLYLASFNMERMGYDTNSVVTNLTERVKCDLERTLQTSVAVQPFTFDKQEEQLGNLSHYTCIDATIADSGIEIDNYTETPSLLNSQTTSGEGNYCTHLLKSNCKVTKQPDWGSIYLHIKGATIPTIESFIKYVVSLRDENHFHEEICEMVYKRITDIFHPEELSVMCLYTRRGGIDICPCRASHAELLNKDLINANFNDTPTFRR